MKLKGLTLLEILITLAIIGIILMIALPNFTGVISSAHSVEAQQQLRTLYSFQTNYKYSHSRYSEDLDAVKFIHNKTIKEGGTAKYRVEIVKADNNSFKAIATALEDFDGDGIFNLWEIDQDQNLVEIVPD